jgi:dolichyl-phosphate beta-glucosyltransferase
VISLQSEALPTCTIVVPCYNEGLRLQGEVFAEFASRHKSIHFLFVNDGSTDNTLSVLEAISRASEGQIRILDKKQNAGKAEAVRSGMLAALETGVACVGFWDADLATPLDAISEFLEVLGSNSKLQMVFGSRVRLLGRHVHRRAVRHYLGRVFASVVSIALRLPIYDTQCGAKIFRATPELSQVLESPFLSRWVFDVEILARYIALHHGSTLQLRESIYEFPLAYWEDVTGSKVRPGDFFVAFFDILRIYRRYLAPFAGSRNELSALSPAGLRAEAGDPRYRES